MSFPSVRSLAFAHFRHRDRAARSGRPLARLSFLTLGIVLLPAAGASGQTFPDIARVDAPACSTDYSLVEDCYNPELPEPPSIERSLEAPGRDHPEIRTWPDGEVGPGKTWVQPDFRTSNDGRLFMENAGSRPAIGVFRPENLDYDSLQKGDGGGWGEDPQRSRQTVFPAAWLPVARTRFDLSRSWPAAYHNTMCDDSSSAWDLGSTNATGRNPRSCSAWVSQSTWPPPEMFDPGNAELLDGDCYDVSLLVHAGRDQRWEMSTAPLTVFVPRAKEPDSGEPRLYVYPRTTQDVLPFHGDHSPFHFHFDGTTWDWGWDFERDKLISECVETPPSQRPPYCAYQDDIETSADFDFVFDRDADGQIDPGERWNGNSCNAPNPGQHCGNWALFEPSVTADGRLLVINGDGRTLWYAYSETACSAEGWRWFRPVSAMPYDSRLQGRYPIAAVPFRTTTGEVIERPSPGQPFPEFRGAYAWIDRQGRNLFWAPINDARDGYVAVNATSPCPPDVSDYDCPYELELVGQELVPDESPAKGVSVIGAWTRGKMVHLDNRLNLSVFGNKRPKDRNSAHDFRHEWDMELYRGGATRLAPLGPTSILSSENLYNGYDALSPTLPFDVVWTLSGNHQQSPEVVFDETMSSNAFLVASMNAPFTTFGGQTRVFWDDGFVPTHPEKSVRDHGPGSADFRYRRSPKLQNASTLPIEVSCPDGLVPRPEGCRLLGWTSADSITRFWHGHQSTLTLVVQFDGPIFGIDFCPWGTEQISSQLTGTTLTQVCRVDVPPGIATTSLQQTDTGLFLRRRPNPLGLEPPTHLELLGGARVEPVAAGGVIGTGLWLDGLNDHAHAEFPHPPIHDWYVGTWLDDRSEDHRRRTVFTFADGSRILYRQGEIAAWHLDSDTLRTVDVSRLGLEKSRYFHLGVKVVTVGSQRRLWFYVDGTRLPRTLSFPAEAGHLAFDLTCLAPESHFWLGDPGGDGARPPFRGWVDELRVYALGPQERPTPSWFDELSCNLALGTLVEVRSTDRRSSVPLLRELWQRADDFGLLQLAQQPPASVDSRSSGVGDDARVDKRKWVLEARVCEQLDIHAPTAGPTDFAPQHGRHLCVDRVHRNPRPATADRCLRAEVYGTAGRELQPEEPRPDFSDLPFCLSCHSPEAAIPEQRPEALAPGAVDVPRYADERRQPLDWPALLTGCRPTTAPFDDVGACEPDPTVLDLWLSGGRKIEPEP